MADEVKLCVVVNFDEVRFMISVPSNTTIQELRAEIESTADNDYPQLRGKEIQLLQNPIEANLPNRYTVRDLLQGHNEVFAFSSDYSTNTFRRPDSPSRCTRNPCRKSRKSFSEEQHKIVHDSGCQKEDGHTRSSKLKKSVKKKKRTKWRKEMFVLGKSEEKLSDKDANTPKVDDQKSQVEDSSSEVGNSEVSESDFVPWPSKDTCRSHLKGTDEQKQNGDSDSSSSSSSLSFSDYNGRVARREARKDTKKNPKIKKEKKVEHTMKSPEECPNKGVDTVIKHSTKKGERRRKRATNATTGNDILPTPPISPAVTKKALVSVTGYKNILKTVENNRPMRKRAIKRSVHKVASWLAMHGEHMSKGSEMSEGSERLKGMEEESEGSNEICSGTTDGQNTCDKEPCINTEQLEGTGQEHQSDSGEIEDEGCGGACNLRHDDYEEEGDTDVLSEKNDPLAKLIPTKIVSPATNLMKVSKPLYLPVIEVCKNSVIYYDESPDGEDESGGMLFEAAVKLPMIVLPRVSRKTLFETAVKVPLVVQPRLDSPPTLRETEGSPCGSGVSEEIVEVRTIATQTYPEDFVKESVARNEEMQEICRDPKSRRNQEVSSSRREDKNPNDTWTVVREVQQDMVDGHVIAPGERKAVVHRQTFSTKSQEDKGDNQTAINEMQRGVTHGHIIEAVLQNIMPDQTIRDRQIHESSDTFEDVETSSHPLFDSSQASHNEEDEAAGLASKGGRLEQKQSSHGPQVAQSEDTTQRWNADNELNEAGADISTEVVNPQAKHTETKKKKRTLLEVVEKLVSTKEGEKLSGGEKVPNNEINCDKIVSRGIETPPATDGAESEANIESNRNTKWKTVVREADRDENQTEFVEVNAINSHQQSKRQGNDAFELQTGETNENVGADTECDANESHKASGRMLENLEGNTECQSTEKCKTRTGKERKQKKKKKKIKASAKSSVETEQLGKEEDDHNNVEAIISTELGTAELIENVREDTVGKANEGLKTSGEEGKRKRKRERVSAELNAEVFEKNEGFEASHEKERKRKRKRKTVCTRLLEKDGELEVEKDNGLIEVRQSVELETGETLQNLEDDTECLGSEIHNTSRWKERKRELKSKTVKTKLLDKGREIERDNSVMKARQFTELETGEQVKNLRDNAEFKANEKHKKGGGNERMRQKKSDVVSRELEVEAFEKEERERDNGVMEGKQSKELESKDTFEIVADDTECHANERHKTRGGKERKRERKKKKVAELLEKIEVRQENNIVKTLCERNADLVPESEVVEKKSRERTIKKPRLHSYSSGEDFVMEKKDKMAEHHTVKKALFDEFDAYAENSPVDVKNTKKKKEEKKNEIKKLKKKEKEKEKKHKGDRTKRVSYLGKIEEPAAQVDKEDHFAKPSDLLQPQKSTACIEEKMFSNSSSESEPGISFDQVVARALKASPTKKSNLKTRNKGKGSRSFLDLVEDDRTNRPTERRKSFSSSNITSSLTPSYVRPFNSPPQGFTNILDRTKQNIKSQQRTTPVSLVTRRTTSASVGHKPRELTPREKESFRLGSKSLAALLDDDTIWES